MRYLLGLQENNGEILNCSTCTRPESHCRVCPVMTEEQPRMTPRVSDHLKLYRRMVRYPGALPAVGGLDDQDERTMRLLDVIGDEVDAADRRRQKKAEAKSRGGLLGRLGRR